VCKRLSTIKNSLLIASSLDECASVSLGEIAGLELCEVSALTDWTQVSIRLNRLKDICGIVFSTIIFYVRLAFQSSLLLDLSPEIYFRLHLPVCRFVLRIGCELAIVSGAF